MDFNERVEVSDFESDSNQTVRLRTSDLIVDGELIQPLHGGGFLDFQTIQKLELQRAKDAISPLSLWNRIMPNVIAVPYSNWKHDKGGVITTEIICDAELSHKPFLIRHFDFNVSGLITNVLVRKGYKTNMETVFSQSVKYDPILGFYVSNESIVGDYITWENSFKRVYNRIKSWQRRR